MQGGGGGGGGAGARVGIYQSGGGGGQGGHLEFYEKLTAGASYSYTVGAGGMGVNNADYSSRELYCGGTSSITIGNNTYICEGGSPGANNASHALGGSGGACKKNNDVIIYGKAGANGQTCMNTSDFATRNCVMYGGAGGGAQNESPFTSGRNGNGGSGGRLGKSSASPTVNYFDGTNGGDGYITFEYCDVS